MTGFPTIRAAMTPSTCGPEIMPFEPKPPPRNGLRMWILLRRDPEKSREASLRHGKTLARGIDRKRIAVPCGDDRMRLHRIVILGRGLVGRFDALCRRGETGLISPR